MLKAAKKLKFWSRKKKRKKSHDSYYFPPPPPPLPQCHCCTCSYSTIQPSAPPLPPWLDGDQTHQALLASGMQLGYSNQAQSPPRAITPETSAVEVAVPSGLALPTPSYQQYMAPNPVYGVPVVETAPRRERSFTYFGCVVDLGVRLIRCFCPCVRIREAYYLRE